MDGVVKRTTLIGDTIDLNVEMQCLPMHNTQKQHSRSPYIKLKETEHEMFDGSATKPTIHGSLCASIRQPSYIKFRDQ